MTKLDLIKTLEKSNFRFGAISGQFFFFEKLHFFGHFAHIGPQNDQSWPLMTFTQYWCSKELLYVCTSTEAILHVPIYRTLICPNVVY